MPKGHNVGDPAFSPLLVSRKAGKHHPLGLYCQRNPLCFQPDSGFQIYMPKGPPLCFCIYTNCLLASPIDNVTPFVVAPKGQSSFSCPPGPKGPKGEEMPLWGRIGNICPKGPRCLVAPKGPLCFQTKKRGMRSPLWGAHKGSRSVAPSGQER